MIFSNIFQQSKTTLQISQHFIPLCILAILAVLSSLGIYALMLHPAQDRVTQLTAQLQTAQQTHAQTLVANRTQTIISTTWNALSDYQGFTDLSLDIADLAKRNHVVIPGMGYKFKPLQHTFAAKGTFSFEAQGNYPAIRKFIFELEKRWPYLFIEKLSVERAKKGGGVLFKLTVSTFLKEFPEFLKKVKTS